MTNENRDYCARIAQELEGYAVGRCWMVDGETVVSDTAPDESARKLYIDDYFDNEVLDIEYTISGHLDYIAAKWYVGIGGPTVWIDTRDNAVHLAWGTDTAWYPLDTDTAAAVDAAAEEAYDMARGCR